MMVWMETSDAESRLDTESFLACWQMPEGGGDRFGFCTIGEDGDYYLLDSTEPAHPVWRPVPEPERILVPVDDIGGGRETSARVAELAGGLVGMSDAQMEAIVYDVNHDAFFAAVRSVAASALAQRATGGVANPALSPAMRDVFQERFRQVIEEGYDLSHDDAYSTPVMAQAAAAYAVSAAVEGSARVPRLVAPRDLWPWPPATFKPKNCRRDLIRAGALILAEIERLDRRAGAREDPSPKAAEPLSTLPQGEGYPAEKPCDVE